MRLNYQRGVNIVSVEFNVDFLVDGGFTGRIEILTDLGLRHDGSNGNFKIQIGL